MRDEVEPPDHVLGSQWNIHDPDFVRLVRPLQEKVRERGLQEIPMAAFHRAHGFSGFPGRNRFATYPMEFRGQVSASVH